ncbi:MAG: hypothetical protein WBE46_03740 [Dehalococcoidia bacterium]
MSIDPKEFERYKIRLIKQQDWLDCRKHIGALDNLFKECSNEEEMRMLLELIPHFTCTEETAYWTFYKNQAENIVNDGAITKDNCRIAPTTQDDIPDSAQHICNPFRDMIKRKGGEHNIVKNLFSHVETFIESTKEQNINIIILDDFIGSGNRIAGRIKRCRELVKGNTCIEVSNFKVISFVAMETGKQYIEGHNIEVIAEYILKRGITDFFTEPELSIAKRSMVKMESLIFKNSNHKYSFGYEQSEALYARIKLKTDNDIVLVRAQNNVFPIFWRSSYKDGRPRNTLLYR